MLRRSLLPGGVLALVLAVALRAAAAEESPPPAPTLYRRVKLSLGVHYSTGHYGGSETTEIVYVPLVATVDIDRWRLQGTVPYLAVNGPAGVIEGPNGPIETTDGAADGVGDLLLRGSYLLPTAAILPAAWFGRAWMPYVELMGLVKFPTASRQQGLGTGEFDYGLETWLTWVIGRWAAFGTAGYRFLGSPPGTHLDDVFVGSVGGSYRLRAPFSAGLLLDYRQAPTPATGQRLELVPYASWQVTPSWSIDPYVSAGLADGSPDFGVGTQFGYAW